MEETMQGRRLCLNGKSIVNTCQLWLKDLSREIHIDFQFRHNNFCILMGHIQEGPRKENLLLLWPFL